MPEVFGAACGVASIVTVGLQNIEDMREGGAVAKEK
jgi:hypothetical protein